MNEQVVKRSFRVAALGGVALAAAVALAPAANAAETNDPATPAPAVATTPAPVVPAVPVVPAAPVKPVVPAGTPQPDPTCRVPSLTVAPMKGGIGSRFLVRGVNFSGCGVVGSTVVPTKVLPLEVGLVAKNAKGGKLEKVLAVGKTTPAGSFAVVVTVPPGPAGGLSAIAAVSIDKATKLTYFAVRPFIVVAPAPVAPAPVPTTPVAVPVVPVTQVNVPTVPGAQPVRVNAGSGGQAARSATGGTGAALPIGLAAGGVLLLGGGTVLRRRSTHGTRI